MLVYGDWYVLNETKLDYGLGAVLSLLDGDGQSWVLSQAGLGFDGSYVWWKRRGLDGVLQPVSYQDNSGRNTGSIFAPFQLDGEDGVVQVLANGNLRWASVEAGNLGRFDRSLGQLSLNAGDIRSLRQITPDQVIIGTTEQGGQLSVFDLANAQLQTVSYDNLNPRAFDVIDRADSQWLVAASNWGNLLQAIQIFPTGTTRITDRVGGADGIGLVGLSQVAIVAAYGQDYVLAADSGSHSIFVFELTQNGFLRPLTQVTDGPGTRFGQIQQIYSFTAGGAQHVLAAGAEGGLSLLTLLPNGRLVHRDSLVETAENRLGKTQHLDVQIIGNIAFVTLSAVDIPGLQTVQFDMSDLGVLATDGTDDDDIIVADTAGAVLQGGAGDDVLAGPDGAADFYGGAGADTFVFAPGALQQTVHDFTPGEDRLDFSAFPFLRTSPQLDITPTSDGATIDYADLSIRVISTQNTPLGVDDFFDYIFDWAPNYALEKTRQARPDPITINSQTGHANLAGAEIDIQTASGGQKTLQFNGTGQFDLSDLPDGPASISIAPTPIASTGITRSDAQIALDLILGKAPEWGAASVETYVAADVNMDGVLNSLDVLAILELAQNGGTTSQRFVDPYSTVDPKLALQDPSVDQIEIYIQNGTAEFSAIPVLLGDLDGWLG